MAVHPGRIVKTVSHGETWWSRVKCKCGTLMDSQRWADGFYRITCSSCGEAFLSLLADGSDGQESL